MITLTIAQIHNQKSKAIQELEKTCRQYSFICEECSKNRNLECKNIEGTIGKGEQLASGMGYYELDLLGVMKTHMQGEEKGTTMMFSGREDSLMTEGVGLAVTPRAKSTLRSWHSVSSRLLTAEFLTQMGLLAVIVAYAPTQNSDSLEKDTFYEDLEEIMMRMNNLLLMHA